MIGGRPAAARCRRDAPLESDSKDDTTLSDPSTMRLAICLLFCTLCVLVCGQRLAGFQNAINAALACNSAPSVVEITPFIACSPSCSNATGYLLNITCGFMPDIPDAPPGYAQSVFFANENCAMANASRIIRYKLNRCMPAVNNLYKSLNCQCYNERGLRGYRVIAYSDENCQTEQQPLLTSANLNTCNFQPDFPNQSAWHSCQDDGSSSDASPHGLAGGLIWTTIAAAAVLLG